MKPGHWYALAAAAAVIGGIWWQQTRTKPTGDLVQPQKQARRDDDIARMNNPHPDHPVICHQPANHPGYIYTPHRYPRAAGGEITAVIHKGFSTMRVPNSQDVQWLVAPPSEVIF